MAAAATAGAIGASFYGARQLALTASVVGVVAGTAVLVTLGPNADLLVIGACLTIERSSLPAVADLWRGRSDAWSRRRWVLSRTRVSPRRIRRWFRKRHQVEEL